MRERVDDMSCVASKESPTGFSEEFDHLHNYQCKVLHSRKEETKPAKESKNRYPKIIPCKLVKHSLVLLHLFCVIAVDYNRIILKMFHR